MHYNYNLCDAADADADAGTASADAAVFLKMLSKKERGNKRMPKQSRY